MRSIFRCLGVVFLSGCLSDVGGVGVTEAALTDPDWPGFPTTGVVASETAGELADSLSVSPSGQARYAIPIAVPPGRNGHEPELELRYSSGRGSGYVGVGFDIGGIPAPIRRCAAHDRDSNAVDYTSLAASYCFGDDVLVPTTNRTSNAEFRTRSDMLARITSSGSIHNPTSFRVQLRTGEVITLDQSAKARRWINVDPGGGTDNYHWDTVVTEWLPSQLEDRFGNPITYDWKVEDADVADGSALSVYLNEISYGGPAGAGTRRVRFVYKSRTDSGSWWRSGVQRRFTRLLTYIELYAPEQPGSAAVLQWRYELRHKSAPTTGRSRLDYIRRCDRVGVCMPATTFEWDDGTLEVEAHELDTPLGSQNVPADVDGDGRSDLLRFNDYKETWNLLLATDSGWEDRGTVSGMARRPLPVDTDGDARAELISAERVILGDGGSQYRFHVYAFDPGTRTFTRGALLAIDDAGKEYEEAYAGDWDGDGAPDLLIRDTPEEFWYLRGTGDASVRFEPALYVTAAPDPDTEDHIVVADLDGDGRSAIVIPQTGALSYNEIRPELDGTTSVSAVNLARDGIGIPNAGDLFADVNGDGLEDFVTMYDCEVRFRINTGWGFSPWVVSSGPQHVPCSHSGELEAHVVDYNGDGREDIVYVYPDSLYSGVLISTGAGFEIEPLPFDVFDAPACGQRRLIPLDWNGDGSIDFVRGAVGTCSASRIERRLPGRADTLVGIRRGMGSYDHIVYGSVGASSLDAPDAAACAYPANCASRRASVVIQLDRDNGLGAVPSFTSELYHYGTARRDALSGRFLGFERRRVQHVGRGTVTETTYGGMGTGDYIQESDASGEPLRFRYPAAGLATTVVRATQDGASVELSRISYGYEEHPGSGPGTFITVPLTRRVEEWRGSGGAWSSCLSARLDRYSWAANDVAYQTGPCASASWEAARDSLTAHEDYDEYGHPRRVTITSRRPVFGPYVPLTERTTVFEQFFGDYSGGATITGALPHSTRATNWYVDQPDFARITDSGWVDGAWRSTPRLTQLFWGSRGEALAAIREPGVDPTSLALGAPGPDPDHVRLTREYAYDAAGNVAAVTERDSDGRERASSFGYDEDLVAPRWSRNAAGHLSWVAFHPALGVPLLEVDSNGIETTWRVDGFGRLREERRPDGAGRDVHYWMSSITTYMLGAGSPQITDVDRLGRVVSTSAPGLSTTVSADRGYDDRGFPLWERRPYRAGATPTLRRFTADNFGRITSVGVEPREGDSLRNVFTASFDVESSGFRIATHTEADGDQTRIISGPDGAIVRTENLGDAGWLQTHFVRDTFNALERVTPPDANVTDFDRDVLGRPRVVDDDDRGVVQIRYNAWGEVVEAIRPAAGTVIYRRDALGRVYEEENAGQLATFVYDTATNGIGRLDVAMSAEGHSETYEYDVFGRVSRVSYFRLGVKYMVDFGYDTNGRLSTITYPVVNGTRLVVHYTYDPASGVVTRVHAPTGELDWRLVEHDGQYRPTIETAGSNRIERTYDAAFDVATRTRVRSGTSSSSPLVQDIESFLTTDGNVERRHDYVMARTQYYDYDRADRMWRWRSVAGSGSSRVERRVVYQYTPGGRIDHVREEEKVGTSTTFTETRTQDYRYDGTGGAGPSALTSMVTSSGGATSTRYFGYDDEGRQSSAGTRTVDFNYHDLPRNVTSGAISRSYEQDAFGARAYMYQDTKTWQVVVGGFFERRADSIAGNQSVIYVHGPHGRIAQLRRKDATTSWITEYTHADNLGSVTLLTSSTGAVTERLWYGAFGERLQSNGREYAAGASPASRSTTGFTDHVHDDALDLIDMRGRFYDPRARIFLSPDRFASTLHSQSWSPFSYVMNNPGTLTDPTGWEPSNDNDPGDPDPVQEGDDFDWGGPDPNDNDPNENEGAEPDPYDVNGNDGPDYGFGDDSEWDVGDGFSGDDNADAPDDFDPDMGDGSLDGGSVSGPSFGESGGSGGGTRRRVAFGPRGYTLPEDGAGLEAEGWVRDRRHRAPNQPRYFHPQHFGWRIDFSPGHAPAPGASKNDGGRSSRPHFHVHPPNTQGNAEESSPSPSGTGGDRHWLPGEVIEGLAPSEFDMLRDPFGRMWGWIMDNAPPPTEPQGPMILFGPGFGLVPVR